MPELTNLIQGGEIESIANYLDQLSASDRLAETRTLNRAQQRELYTLAEKAPPITLEHFVPTDRSDLSEVIHYGRNTLPLPGGLKLFEKRFCRPKSDVNRLYGYNEGSTRALIGPGYFVARSTSGQSEWEARGALVVDYFQIPEGDVVQGWPTVVPNTRGIQYFVYNKTRDFMRRVSNHVSIGAAYKVEKALGHYFILCREDESEQTE
jgi:hypothetical protein